MCNNSLNFNQNNYLTSNAQNILLLTTSSSNATPPPLVNIAVANITAQSQSTEHIEKRPALAISQSTTQESLEPPSKRQAVHAAGLKILSESTPNTDFSQSTETDKLKLLIEAVNMGHRDQVISLISSMVAIDPVYLHELLAAAVAHGHADIIPLLVTAGADIHNGKNSFDKTPLMLAVIHGHTDIVRLLITLGANKEVQDKENKTALIHAAQKGHKAIVELLINAGASINTCDFFNMTPLMYAAEGGFEDLAEFFLSLEADKEVRDCQNKTALHHAVSKGHKEIVKLLITSKVNLETQDMMGDTALSCAVILGDSEIVELLIQAQANIHVHDFLGTSILTHAVLKCHLDIIRLLLVAGIDICSPLNRDAIKTAYYLSIDAQGEEHGEADRMLSLFANTPDPTGITGFLRAAQQGRLDLVQIIIPYLGDYNDLETGFILALESGHTNVAQYISRTTNPHNLISLQLEGKDIPFTHSFYKNKLYLTVDRQKMNREFAEKCLDVITEYLRVFKEIHHGQFSDVSLSVAFMGENGIDGGGLSAEFITLLFTTLFTEEDPLPLFSKLEDGTYLLGSEQGTPMAKDFKRCKQLGIFLAAIFSGYPKDSESHQCKIPTLFPNQVYQQLLAVYQYATNRQLLPFEEMDQEGKEALVHLVSEHDTNNVFYKKMSPLFESRTYSDRDLEQVLHFLIYDYLECGEPIHDSMQKPLEQFINIADCIKLLHSDIPAEVTTEDGHLYDLKTLLRDNLRNLLGDKNVYDKLHMRFVESRNNHYAHVCAALAAIGEGFVFADRLSIAFLMHQFRASPQAAAKKMATCIQGKPVTHEAFVKLLQRSSIDDKVSEENKILIQQKITWLIEWCDTGIAHADSTQNKQATIEEIKQILHCFTAARVITDKISFMFATPVKGMSEFHTCTHTVNMGHLALRHADKSAFIQEWMDHIQNALGSKEFTLV